MLNLIGFYIRSGGLLHPNCNIFGTLHKNAIALSTNLCMPMVPIFTKSVGSQSNGCCDFLLVSYITFPHLREGISHVGCGLLSSYSTSEIIKLNNLPCSWAKILGQCIFILSLSEVTNNIIFNEIP